MGLSLSFPFWLFHPSPAGEADTVYDLTDGKRLMLGNNRVIIYIWTSQNSGGRGCGHVSVEITRGNKNGTLEKYTYISFWPGLPPPEGLPPLPEYETDEINCRWSFIKDYTGDRLLEKRTPEHIFCFYTLETSDIIAAFRLFMEQPEKTWEFLGEYFPRTSWSNMNDEQVVKYTKQSCVSLACLALDAGSINKLLDIKDVANASAKQLTDASSANSKEMYQELNFIKPSQHTSMTSLMVMAAISCYVISPDVLVERLKKAKIKELKFNENVRKMGRTICTTKIASSERSISFSFQTPESEMSAEHVTPYIYEKTYEWLPMDDK